jgi:hypothetical protein
VTSGGIRSSKETPIIKKTKPSLLSKEEQRKKEKTKVLTLNRNMTIGPSGVDAKSDRAGWLPAVSYCSATKQ